MMDGKMDARKRAIEELLAHLDMKDGEELGSVVKPKDVAVEAISVKKPGEPDGDEGMDAPGMAPGSEGDDSGSKMSDEELDELIQAIQSKLGA